MSYNRENSNYVVNEEQIGAYLADIVTRIEKSSNNDIEALDTIKKRSMINTSQFSIGCTWPFKYMRSTFKGLFVFILCVTLPPVGSLSLLSGQLYPRSVPLRAPANLPGRLK